MASRPQRSWLLATPTPAAFAAFAAVSVLAVPAGAIAPYGGLQLSLRQLLLGAVITAAAGAAILAGTLLARGLATRPIGHASVILASFAVAGALRGWLYFKLSPAFDVETSTSLPLRIANSTITTVFWMAICTVGFHSQTAYRRRLESILGQALLQRFTRISRSELTAEFAGIEDAIRSVSNNPEGLTQSQQMLRVADEVRAVVNSQIRPLSHRLWLQGHSLYPRLRYRALFADALRQLPYHPVRVAGFFAVTAGVNLSNATGVESATIRVVVATATFLACHLWLRPAARSAGVTGGLLYLAVVSILTNLVQAYAATGFGLPSGLPESLAFAPYIAAVMLLDGTATLAVADRQQLLDDLKRALGHAESDVDPADVASYLHNSLQGELLAVATQLEVAATGTPEQQRRSVEQLGALLSRSIGDDFTALSASPADRLRRAIEQWQGLLEFELRFDPAEISSDPRAATLVQIIEETASNAVRHGGATRLSVSLATSPNGDWALTLDNDGRLGGVGSGLGADWLRTHTRSSEVTALRDGGVRCHFTL